MSKYWLAKEFKRLQSEWYSKLNETGFVDIEEPQGMLLKQRGSPASVFKGARLQTIQYKHAYFDLLSARVNGDEKFDSEVDELVMRMTAEGSLISEIWEKLKTQGLSKSRCTIRFIRRRYENKWKIRKWSPKQMHLKK